MWGYQHYFRVTLESRAKSVLEALGAQAPVKALLVGVLRPGEDDPNAVCIEDEDDPVKQALFEDLEDQIQQVVRDHPLQHTFYGDDLSNDEKPERIRADSIRTAVRSRLERHDGAAGTVSRVGGAQRVRKYDVLPVLRFGAREWNALLHLKKTAADERYPIARGLAEAAVDEVLRGAREALAKADPGRDLSIERRDAADVCRAAGLNLMYVPGWAVRNFDGLHGLFHRFNTIAGLRHENAEGRGEVVVARRDHPAVDVAVRFKLPVPLGDGGWARKVLQTASHERALLCDGATLYGLGSLSPDYDPHAEDAFRVRFVGHHKWELWHGAVPLMRVEYGAPAVPKGKLNEAWFKHNASRVLGGDLRFDAARLWEVVSVAVEQRHGTLVVVSSDAFAEAERLQMQATAIDPIQLPDDLVRDVTAIDGAVLLDPSGVCHAIGVILDGMASSLGTPSRGARYNSAVRYVDSAAADVLAVVVSEDGNVDVIPTLRPQIRRSELQEHVEAGRKAIAESNWEAISRELRWFADRRFYLREAECAVANDLVRARAQEPSEEGRLVGRLVIQYREFTPSEGMDDSYLELEGGPADEPSGPGST